MYVDGCRVILRQLDTAQTGNEVIEALSERYEVEALDPAQLLLRVKVNDARLSTRRWCGWPACSMRSIPTGRSASPGPKLAR